VKAKDIKPGDVFPDAVGVLWTVASADRAPAFKLSLEGHPDMAAIMVTYRGGQGDWTLYHPEQEVDEPIQRSRAHTSHRPRTRA
jgi:hypothetical protein